MVASVHHEGGVEGRSQLVEREFTDDKCIPKGRWAWGMKAYGSGGVVDGGYGLGHGGGGDLAGPVLSRAIPR